MTTEEKNFPVTDRLVSAFYDMLQSSGKTYHEGLRLIGPLTRRALALRTLDGQVCNGGFSQWISNGYAADHGQEVLAGLQEIATSQGYESAAHHVLALVKHALTLGEEPRDEDDYEEWATELDKLDTLFYAVDEKLRVEVESHLVELEARLATIALP